MDPRALFALLPLAGCLPTPSALPSLGEVQLTARADGEHLALELALTTPADRGTCERHPARLWVDEQEVAPVMRWTGRCAPNTVELPLEDVSREPVVWVGLWDERHEATLFDAGARRSVVGGARSIALVEHRWHDLWLEDDQGEQLDEELTETWAALELDGVGAVAVAHEEDGEGQMRVKVTQELDDEADCTVEGCPGTLEVELTTELLVECAGFAGCAGTAITASVIDAVWIDED